MGLRLSFTFIILCVWSSAYCNKDLNVMANWKILEFGFDSKADRQNALDNGFEVNNTSPPIDLDIRYTKKGDPKIYITIPRIYKGIPYTLALVSKELGPNGPIVYPYPNYEWHKNKSDCNGIISAYRMAIDDCNHMWVIDSGVDVENQICPPQLLTFDLKTNQLIHRYQFSEDVYTPAESVLTTPVVDVRDLPPVGHCEHVMVYVADPGKSGVVVYNSQRDAAWRVENQLMEADPNWKNHTIAGQRFTLTDGLFTLSLTPRRRRFPHLMGVHFPLAHGLDQVRYLYFHALASQTENKVALRYIDNQTIWQNNKEAMPEAFIELGKRGVQATMEAMDSKGYLYTNIYDPLTVIAWNTSDHEYNPSVFKVVADNPNQLQFASGMKVIRNPLGQEELWLSTCKNQKVKTGTLDPNEVNFMILACTTDDLLSRKGRKCRTFGKPTAVLP